MREVCVVTGASRGIGRATSLAVARRGISVALLGRPSQALEEAAKQVCELGVKGYAVTCDVTLDAQVADAAGEVVRTLGVPRIVVNNAGIVRRGLIADKTAMADWDEVIAVNLRGPFVVTRAFLPWMLAERRGRFIHVASISATIGSPGAASYAASKWGLVGFSKSLAEELRGTGLQSIAILPGSVDTDMLVGSGFKPAMTAEDVARLIVNTALDAPDAVNGSAIEMFG